MVTENGFRTVDANGKVRSFAELNGLSTDTKPTNVANGSTFLEMNTGKVFVFNEDTQLWVEL